VATAIESHGVRGVIAIVRIPGMGWIDALFPWAARVAVGALLKRLRVRGSVFAILDGEWTIAVWVPVDDRAGYGDMWCRATGPIIFRGGLLWPRSSVVWVGQDPAETAWTAYRDVIGAQVAHAPVAA
jgi:hypothetical protein